MKLYEITDSYKLMEQLANEAETDDEIERFRDVLIQLEGAFEEKVENIVYVLKNMEADIGVLKAEEKRLNEKRKSIERKTDNLKDYLFGSFLQTGTERIKYPQFTVSIRNNPESVNIKDISKIPEEFLIPQEPKLDKTGIKKAIQGGMKIDGAELIRNKSLQIR